MQYRREIDGLRALAVLPVILFHAGISSFRGGFIGVDIFFVISGYLISQIIVTDLQINNFSIVNFYERRFRRILPALFFVMLICLPFSWYWLSPADAKDFSKSLIAVSIFSSNILFWREVGYFASAAELKPLLHTWSLAIEEQFYIFFPLILILTWKLGTKVIVVLIGLAAIASLGLAHWGAQVNPEAAFFLLPTRGWELAVGAIVGILHANKSIAGGDRDGNNYLACLGLCLIFYSFYFFSDPQPFPSVNTLLPVAGAVLVLLFATQQTLPGRLLGTSGLVWIGLISYSAYLWHQPLFAFARQRSMTEPSLSLMIVLSCLTLVFAWVSWRFIEQPFRIKQKISRSGVFVFATVGSLLFISVGLIGYLTDGYFHRDNYKQSFSKFEEQIRPNQGLSSICDGAIVGTPECKTHENPEMILWGDSNAMHLAQALAASHPNLKFLQATMSVCGPILDIAPINNTKYVREWSTQCMKFNDSVFEYIKQHKSIKYAVVSSAFRQYTATDWNVMLKNGEILSANQNSIKYFKETLRRLQDIGIQPVVVSPTPQDGHNIGRCLIKSKVFNINSEACDVRLDVAKAKEPHVYEFLSEIEKSYPVIWLGDAMCVNGICNATVDSTPIYADVGHLTRAGSAYVGTKLNLYKLITDTK